MPVLIGQPAPAFSLYDTEKRLVTLEEHKGKTVLLLFFPLAFSSVCTKELCAVRDDISVYNEANATVFGISVDSFYVLKKFKEEQGLNFGLLSDFNKDASKAYDVLYESFGNLGMKGVSKRAAFVIDGAGIVQYAEICPSPADLPDFSKIQAVLLDGRVP